MSTSISSPFPVTEYPKEEEEMREEGLEEELNYNNICGNCGIKLEGDNSNEDGDFTQLRFNSPIYERNPQSPEFNQLLASYSVSVVEALTRIFKFSFEKNLKIIDLYNGWILCESCSINLKDLYILWNSFITKTSEEGILYKFIFKKPKKEILHSSSVSVDNLNEKKRMRGRPRGSTKTKGKTNTPQTPKSKGERKSMRRKVRTEVEISSIVEAVYNKNEEEDEKKNQDYLNHEYNFNNWNNMENGAQKNSTRIYIKKRRGCKRKKIEIKPKETLKRKRPRNNKKEDKIESDNEDDVDVIEDKEESDFDPNDCSGIDGDVSEDEKRRRERRVRKRRNFINNDNEGPPPKNPRRRHVPVNARPEVCLDCGRRFLSKIGVEVHNRVIHLNIHGPYVCDMENCERRFKCQRELEHHMNVHLGIKPYICDKCGWATTGDTLLRNHLRNKHTSSAEKELLKTKVCEVCGAKFIRGKDLQSHMVVHTNERPHHCSFLGCEAKFKLIQKLKLHEKEVHLDTVPKYPCPRCKREFNRKHNLKLHVERHNKYDLLGTNMRKSRDPPIRNKIIKVNHPPPQPLLLQSLPTTYVSPYDSHPDPPLQLQNYSIPFLTQL